VRQDGPGRHGPGRGGGGRGDRHRLPIWVMRCTSNATSVSKSKEHREPDIDAHGHGRGFRQPIISSGEGPAESTRRTAGHGRRVPHGSWARTRRGNSPVPLLLRAAALAEPGDDLAAHVGAKPRRVAGPRDAAEPGSLAPPLDLPSVGYIKLIFVLSIAAYRGSRSFTDAPRTRRKASTASLCASTQSACD
jgi:hypothetical protein